MHVQGEFQFDASAKDGYAQWVTLRRTTAEEMGRKLNLPVGHKVEVWLRGGVRLRGKLNFQEEFLLIEEDRLRELVLVVDNVPFTYPEMESCVRTDDY